MYRSEIMSGKNSWDSTWEDIFRTKEWGKYPSEDLVRFMARNYYRVRERSNCRILDLGCGTGANTWFMAREGFDVYAIDGSETAIAIAKKRFEEENLEADFRVGDFIDLDYADGFFDCVVDVASLQHNKMEDIGTVLEEVRRVLKPGGKVFSVMKSDSTILGKDVNLFTEQRFVYYFGTDEIESLFSGFIDPVIDESTRTDSINGNTISHFIIQATRAR